MYKPTDPTVNDWLNKRLKREEDADQYFLGYPKAAYTAQFMTITYPVTERCKREAPAVVHVDGTARPQVVNETNNPAFYKILKSFKKKTGLPLCINTSFNIHEEPIVCTPEDAVRCFLDGHLDVLAIGDFIGELSFKEHLDCNNRHNNSK